MPTNLPLKMSCVPRIRFPRWAYPVPCAAIWCMTWFVWCFRNIKIQHESPIRKVLIIQFAYIPDHPIQSTTPFSSTYYSNLLTPASSSLKCYNIIFKTHWIILFQTLKEQSLQSTTWNMHILFSVLQGAIKTAYQSAVRDAVRCFDIQMYAICSFCCPL